MQIQIVILVVVEQKGRKVVAPRPNTKFNAEIAKLLTFDRDTSKVAGFVMICKIYIRIRMRDISVKKQIQ